jgi:hypothetical protein
MSADHGEIASDTQQEPDWPDEASDFSLAKIRRTSRKTCQRLYKPLMANIQLVCLFVKSRQHVLAKFNDLRKTYHITRSLKLTKMVGSNGDI